MVAQQPAGTRLFRCSGFEPILYTPLLRRGRYSPRRKGIVFFSLLFIEYGADSLHRRFLKRSKPVNASAPGK